MLNLFERAFLLLLSMVLLSACGTSKHSQTRYQFGDFSEYVGNKNHFTGFLVVDAKTQDTVYSINAKKYFTPASTTKIFTLYTALKLLPKQIPALRYINQNDTLYFEGTGDPTQLHPYFKDVSVVEFLKEHNNLNWCANNYQGALLGPGWAWEDYQYYYQVERGAMPLYGNVARIYRNQTLQVTPDYFKKNVIDLKHSSNREINSNTFYYDSSRRDTTTIPFRTDSILTKKLLENLLQKPISTKSAMPQGEKSILYSVPSDSVYKRMMHESDNFLADQLLVLSSGMLSDTLNVNKAIAFVLQKELSDLRQLPRWVDGSGLSRYNLFTPESMVQVLGKLKQDIEQERLFKFFVPNENPSPNGSNTAPYIYAKSGSIGNNYSLNGYLLTKSGKLLIFSFMNNHFTESSSGVRLRVQEALKRLHDSY